MRASQTKAVTPATAGWLAGVTEATADPLHAVFERIVTVGPTFIDASLTRQPAPTDWRPC